jgi:tetratricopeptide (TPR) repeat protein
LALTEDNYIAHSGLAGYLHKQGKAEEAAAHLRAVIAIRPDDWPAHLLLGDHEVVSGNLEAAAEQFQMVALRESNVALRAKAYADLGMVYRKMGQPLQAKQNLETSLQLVPSQPTIMVTLGLIAQKDGDLHTAVRLYTNAMAKQPTDVGYLLLAQALQDEGRADEANVILQRVARISANLPQARKQAEALLAGK